jgi:hypothetical protein
MRSDAASRDVTIKPERKEFVSPMVQQRNDAASKDVSIKPEREEFVLLMAPRM